MDSNLKKLLQKLNREDDKLKTLIIDNLTIEKAFEGNSEVSLKVTNSMLNVHNMVHGGVLFTVADSSAGLACVSLGKKVVTLNSNINYLKPVDKGTIWGIGKVVHKGNNTMVVDVSVIRQEDKKLLSKATFTMFVIGKYDIGE